MISPHAKSLLALLVALLVASDLFGEPPQTATKPEPTIFVEASYPGASANVLADTVAAPIEEEVSGVENLLHMVSRCGGDGKYVLALTFKSGTDLNAAQVMVQNRVCLAQPILPKEVMAEGVTVKRKAPVLMLINLSSPDGTYDTLFLSNYATFRITDELQRLPGVGDVRLFGQRDYRLRVWLDPQKMAARDLAASDVVAALKKQNAQVAPEPAARAPKDQEFQLTIGALGRLTEPEQFADIIIKAGTEGNIVYLKDVARVESGSSSADRSASFNGKPGVVLAIYPTGAKTPKEVSRAVADKLAALRDRAPKGLDYQIVFDFTANLETPNKPTTPEYLLLDVHVPANDASSELTRQTLTRCEKGLREVQGVQDVLALTENPFDPLRNQPCLLARLTPADRRKIGRQEMVWSVRAQFEKVPGAAIRIRDLARPESSLSYGYPITLAIGGPDAKKVWELADKFGERLQASKKLTDVWVDRESRPRPQLVLDIDRTKARALGVELKDVLDTIQVYLGSGSINNFNEFGRTWQLTVLDEKATKSVEDLLKLQARNADGKMVRLGTLISARTADAPPVIKRFDGKPVVEVSANPVTALSVEKARELCEVQFDEVRRSLRLPAGYQLIWLQEASKSK
jgi:multidrug efflux pump subunit AcrB